MSRLLAEVSMRIGEPRRFLKILILGRVGARKGGGLGSA